MNTLGKFRRPAALGAAAVCSAALLVGGATAVQATPAGTVETQIGRTPVEMPPLGQMTLLTLQDRSGKQLTAANGYDETPTGQVTTTLTLPAPVVGMFRLMMPVEGAALGTTISQTTDGPFDDGTLGVSQMSVLQRNLAFSGIYGDLTENVAYSGDSVYRPTSKRTAVTVVPDNGRRIPTGSLTARPGTPAPTVLVNLPSDATGSVRGVCVSAAEVKRFLADQAAWANSNGTGTQPTLPDAFAHPQTSPVTGGTATITCGTGTGTFIATATYSGNATYGPLFLAVNADPTTGGTTAGIDPATALAPGQKNVQVTVTGLTPNTEYTRFRKSTPIMLGKVVSNAQGVATFTDALPDDLSDGTHHYTLETAGGQQVASIPFAVSFLAPPKPDAALNGPAGTTGPGTGPGTGGENPGQPSTGSLGSLFGSAGS